MTLDERFQAAYDPSTFPTVKWVLPRSHGLSPFAVAALFPRAFVPTSCPIT